MEITFKNICILAFILLVWPACLGLFIAAMMHGFVKTSLIMFPVTIAATYFKVKLEVEHL